MFRSHNDKAHCSVSLHTHSAGLQHAATNSAQEGFKLEHMHSFPPFCFLLNHVCDFTFIKLLERLFHVTFPAPHGPDRGEGE